MKITFLFTGKTKDSSLITWIGDYLNRIRRYVPLEVTEVPDIRLRGKNGPDEVKKKEGEQILRRIKPADHVVLLDEKGKRFSSVQLARHLEGLEGRTAHTVFVIGGPYGFSAEIFERANERLSLSAMTFPHQLVRVIFAEQIYRAYSILNGEPYHHE